MHIREPEQITELYTAGGPVLRTEDGKEMPCRGNGEVVLIAGGGKVYTDIAARFVRSERPITEIIASEYDPQIVRNIIESGHLAATEFDMYIFGVSGYSRVCETQLVRKRHASYIIKSGRCELGGKRKYSVVIPHSIRGLVSKQTVLNVDTETHTTTPVPLNVTTTMLNQMIAQWYADGMEAGAPEEDLRYMKPQATEFQAIIAMNAHALLDWFRIRCCRNAQEIRDMAWKMLHICKETSPEVFMNAGPNCVYHGYCTEGKRQHPKCKAAGLYLTRDQALQVLRDERRQRLGIGASEDTFTN